MAIEKAIEKATFGAGCFWQVEVEFRNTPGVTDVAVGYSGGEVEHPTYEQVCRADTGHAEVVEVSFDPGEVSYSELLEKFFSLHDPTQRDRQGPDVGRQYRSAIFFHSPEQEREAIAARDAEQPKHRQPIATEISPAKPFWRAEDYHQRYLEKRGLATCRI
ncbi:MAG: peptide-methionine (S)-S-oxide reductase [Solirubrobacterales bacterium]|jgi:peptide-methionine (S)-S-oxide reductase|nr:peptide-methionine (S)-S-oxide reductase [Solirubrobacterales bacterium]